jgi:hypothetical protein
MNLKRQTITIRIAYKIPQPFAFLCLSHLKKVNLNESPSTNIDNNKRTAHPYAWSFYMTFCIETPSMGSTAAIRGQGLMGDH